MAPDWEITTIETNSISSSNTFATSMTSNSSISGWEPNKMEKAIFNTFIFIRAYITIPLICIGIFGNGMSIIIFLQTRKTKDTASVQYLLALAISDATNLVLYGLTEWFRSGAYDATHGRWSYELLAQNNILCKITRYLSFITFHLSSWIIVTFAAERLVAVWFPLRSTRLISSSRRKKVIFALVFSTIILKIPYLDIYEVYVVDVSKNDTTCFFNVNKWNNEGYIYIFTDFFLATFLPCVILCVINTIIIIGVLRSKKAVKNRTSSSKEQRKAMETKCVINLIVVSSLFVILEIPYVVTWLKYFVLSAPDMAKLTNPDEEKYVQFLFELAKLFSSFKMLNYSLNFIVYTLSLDFYRRRFQQLICCCCRHKLPSPQLSDRSNHSDRNHSFSSRSITGRRHTHTVTPAEDDVVLKPSKSKIYTKLTVCFKCRNIGHKSSNRSTPVDADGRNTPLTFLSGDTPTHGVNLDSKPAELVNGNIPSNNNIKAQLGEDEFPTMELQENNSTYFVTKF